MNVIEILKILLLENKLNSWESGFASSILKKSTPLGSNLTEKQLNCVHKITDKWAGSFKGNTQLELLEFLKKDSKKPTFLNKGVQVSSMSDVVTLMNKVKGFPKLWFKLPNDADLCIYKATERSKYAEQLQLTGGAYGSAYYGRITQQGELFVYPEGKKVEKELTTLLKRLGADPSRVASEYGKLTGSCSFCHRKLSDERSKEVGYGSTCASNYDLEWGKKKEVV